jgi:hypothetical protein
MTELSDENLASFYVAAHAARDSGRRAWSDAIRLNAEQTQYDLALIEKAELCPAYVALSKSALVKKIACQIEALNQIQYDKDVIKAKPIKAPTLMDSEHERPSGFLAPPKDAVRLQSLEFYASVAQAIHLSRFADENPNLIAVASPENIQKTKQLAQDLIKQLTVTGIHFPNALLYSALLNGLTSLTRLKPSTPQPVLKRNSARAGKVEFVKHMGEYFYRNYREYFIQRIATLSSIAFESGGIAPRQVDRDLDLLRAFHAEQDKFSLKTPLNLS